MGHRKASVGFTLIEVLIAMTLLGIMVVLLFTSMKICADSWQKGEDKITQVNDIAVVYQFFQHHLSIAKPLWDDFTDDNEVFAFQGKNQELQFVSSFPASAKKSGLQYFSLKLINEGNEQLIQVSITPFFPSAEGEEWRKEEVTLLRHVSSFSLSYYALDESETEGVWQEDWLEQNVLPRLVKIKIERDDGGFWPEMIVELKSKGLPSDADDQSLDDTDQTLDDANQTIEESIIEDQ
jgi:general secretion pathway protein J